LTNLAEYHKYVSVSDRQIGTSTKKYIQKEIYITKKIAIGVKCWRLKQCVISGSGRIWNYLQDPERIRNKNLDKKQIFLLYKNVNSSRKYKICQFT